MRTLICALLSVIFLAACGGDAATVSVTPSTSSYVAEVLPVLEGLQEVTEEVSSSVLAAADNPSLLTSESWFSDLDRQQARLQRLQADLLRLRPPPDLAATHDYLTQSVAELAMALALLETGARRLDSGSIKAATEHILASGRLLDKALAALPEKFR